MLSLFAIFAYPIFPSEFNFPDFIAFVSIVNMVAFCYSCRFCLAIFSFNIFSKISFPIFSNNSRF